MCTGCLSSAAVASIARGECDIVLQRSGERHEHAELVARLDRERGAHRRLLGWLPGAGGRRRRQCVRWRHRVGRGHIGVIGWFEMRQRGQRQAGACAGRPAAGQPFAPHVPAFADRRVAVAAQRQDDAAGRNPLESAHDARACRGVEQFRLPTSTLYGSLPSSRKWTGVFNGGLYARGDNTEFFRDAFGETPRIVGRRLCAFAFARNQPRVAPQRLAVAPPVEREGPARHRFARIPFAEAVMRQALRRKAFAQPADQLDRRARVSAHRAPRWSIRAIGSSTDTNVGSPPRWPAARRALQDPRSTASPSASSAAHASSDSARVNAGRRGHACHGHLEEELGLRLLYRARRAARRSGNAASRRAECGLRPRAVRRSDRARSSRRWESTPRPRRAGCLVPLRAVVGRHIRLQLDQIARHEARLAGRGGATPAPAATRCRAGPGTCFERFLRRARAGLHPHRVAHGALQPIVEIGQERHGIDRPARHLGHEGAQAGAERLKIDIGRFAGAPTRPAA